jgi:phage terminase large subunit-like protein
MLVWITDYIIFVKKNPKDFGEDIKLLIKLVEKLLKDNNVQFKPADPIAFYEFCKSLTHKEGEWGGQPFILSFEQKFITACIFGFKEYSKRYNGWIRFFRELHIFVARKWGKTLFISALALWMLGFDKERGAYGCVLAENEVQAKKLYNLVCRASHQKVFKNIFIEQKTNKILSSPRNEGEFTYLSGRSKGKDGDNPSFFVIDEAHEITNKKQYTSKVTGTGARKQPLGIVISTAGVVPDSLYEPLLEKDKKILRKKKFDKKDRIFPIIFSIDDGDDPLDEKCWPKANPGMSENRPSIEFVRNQLEKLKDTPEFYSEFIAKHLNRHIGASIDYFDFLAIKRAAAEIKREDFYNTYAVGGVDLAETTDLCNATADILLPNGKMLYLQAYFMAAERMQINSKRDKMQYSLLTNCDSKENVIKKLFIITPGSYVQKEYITQWYCELRDVYKINFLKIGYDRALSKEWLTDMQEHGFSHEIKEADKEANTIYRDAGILTAVAQGGLTLSPAIKIIKSLFDDGRLIYDKSNLLLPYCFYNLKIRIDTNNNMAPHRSRSTGHIDGSIGVFNSFVAYDRAKTIYKNYENLQKYFEI